MPGYEEKTAGASRSEQRPKLDTPGRSTLIGSDSPATAAPGKSTHTSHALPRTTSEAGVPGPAATSHDASAGRSPSGDSPKLTSGAKPQTASVQHYADMLDAVLAARDIAARTQPDDAAAHAQILGLLAPVEKRLSELNDHQGRLAQFGAGNIAGQAALDMAETAVRSWRQRLMLGTIVRTDEHVLRFRSGAEVIRFLTGESANAATLRAFDHASRVVGIGVAVPILAPALVALAGEEAALLAFAGRVAARRVVVWALSNPAAALAASEALLGFGVQIGEGGWERFWDQLQDPQGRWFVIAQVLMDFMHVKTSISPRGGASAGEAHGEPDVVGARQHVAKARAVLQQVHDGAASEAGQHQGSDRSGHEQPQSRGVQSKGQRQAASPPKEMEGRGQPYQVSSDGFRNEEPLTPDQIREATEYAQRLGVPADVINVTEIMNTSWASLFGVERLNIGTDVAPSTDPRIAARWANSRVTTKAAVAHEVVGHRAAGRAGMTQEQDVLEEAQASIRAARYAPELTSIERLTLIRDAVERLKKAGLKIADVRDSLWIHEP